MWEEPDMAKRKRKNEAKKYLLGALGTISGTRAAILHGGEVDPHKCLDDIKADINKAMACLCGRGERSIPKYDNE